MEYAAKLRVERVRLAKVAPSIHTTRVKCLSKCIDASCMNSRIVTQEKKIQKGLKYLQVQGNAYTFAGPKGH